MKKVEDHFRAPVGDTFRKKSPFGQLLEHMGKQTINDTLDLGKNLIEKKITKNSNEFYQLLDTMLPRLLENEQTIQYCRKSHRNFKKLESAVKKIFENQVIPIVQLLMVEDASIYDYPSLCKAACTKSEIESLLTAQVNAMEESIKVIEEDLSILNVPIARDFVIRVIKEGIKIKRNSFFIELDQIYA